MPHAVRKYGPVSVLPTPVFFYGMQPGDEITDRDRARQGAGGCGCRPSARPTRKARSRSSSMARSERIAAMRYWLLLFLLAGLPLFTWAADECNGAPPYDCAVTLIQQGRFPAASRRAGETDCRIAAEPQGAEPAWHRSQRRGRPRKGECSVCEQALEVDPAFLPALKNLSINEFAAGPYGPSQSGPGNTTQELSER